ncbi:hypothetical protein HHI36_011695, partial [Cryptolaemus montrouzieri]
MKGFASFQQLKLKNNSNSLGSPNEEYHSLTNLTYDKSENVDRFTEGEINQVQ